MADDDTAIGDLMRLDGRHALVTGASGNIGRRIACRLAEAGAAVTVHYFRDEAGAARTAADILAAGGSATVLQADLSTGRGAAALLDAACAGRAPPHCIVNNAALQPVVPLIEMSGDEWRQVLATTLDAAFHVTQAAAGRLRAAGTGGAIVNVASIEGLDPAPGHAHYAAAKAGLISLTRSVALEYGPAGIRCNAVSPGLIDRDGLADEWPDGLARWLERVPLGRTGSATDVANAVLFLLGAGARFVNGANLVVDGGMSARPRW